MHTDVLVDGTHNCVCVCMWRVCVSSLLLFDLRLTHASHTSDWGGAIDSRKSKLNRQLWGMARSLKAACCSRKDLFFALCGYRGKIFCRMEKKMMEFIDLLSWQWRVVRAREESNALNENTLKNHISARWAFELALVVAVGT